MIEIGLLKAALRVRGTKENDYLKFLETAAVAHIERATGRYYGPVRTTVEVVRGGGTGRLYLDGPIATDVYGEPMITSVAETAYHGAVPIAIVLDASDGFQVRGNLLLRLGSMGWARDYEYAVTYQQGYDEGDEPPNIRQAVKQLVTHWFEHRLPVSDAGLTTVPLSVQAIINGHKRLRI